MDYRNQYSQYCDRNVIDWVQEANAIIKDIAMHVKEVFVSHVLQPSASESYFNITTLGGQRLCVKVFSGGLQIVGDDYDEKNKENTKTGCYETPYAMLSEVCPLYVNSFGNALAYALNRVDTKSSESP